MIKQIEKERTLRLLLCGANSEQCLIALGAVDAVVKVTLDQGQKALGIVAADHEIHVFVEQIGRFGASVLPCMGQLDLAHEHGQRWAVKRQGRRGLGGIRGVLLILFGYGRC